MTSRITCRALVAITGLESAPHAGGEKIPRDDQVTGGIAHSRGREVDDSTEPTLEDQQISGQQV